MFEGRDLMKMIPCPQFLQMCGFWLVWDSGFVRWYAVSLVVWMRCRSCAPSRGVFARRIVSAFLRSEGESSCEPEGESYELPWTKQANILLLRGRDLMHGGGAIGRYIFSV